MSGSRVISPPARSPSSRSRTPIGALLAIFACVAVAPHAHAAKPLKCKGGQRVVPVNNKRVCQPAKAAVPNPEGG
jgi:hypothetical protein